MWNHISTAYFAGGCFWDVEHAFQDLQGIIQTEVGFSGGPEPSPTYEEVATGQTGHYEVVKIEFDAARITYRELVQHFFKIHDPTQWNRQGSDIGYRYGSALFFIGEDQKATALEVIQEVEFSGKWNQSVVTQVIPFTSFFPADASHQHFWDKHRRGLLI